VRPIWKGTITFGLVTIPVGLYSDDRDPRFRSRRRHRLRVLTETLRKAIEATPKARRPHKEAA